MRRTAPPPYSTWPGRILAPLFLLALTVVYFWPQLVGGRVLYWGDVGLYFTPMQSFLRDNLRAGHLPLWNPLLLCGTPYVGNPQTWPLYPVTFLLPWVSASQFLNLTVALHVWLAGLGTYLFARRALGLGRVSGLLAAITFMFGGQLVSKEQFPNMVQASAWLPWVLWSGDGLLRRRRTRDALVLGGVLGLQLLAAHVQMTVLTLYLAAAYGVFKMAPPAPNHGGRGAIPLLLLSGLVAAGLAMGQILPTLALFRDAARQRLPFEIVDRFFLPANQLANFALPRLHGHPFSGDWTARGNFWETCCYVGWIPLALAVWGAVGAWRRGGAREIQFWTLVFVFGVWMAMGGRGGLYHLAYFVLPGFRSFHDPARCLLWACFALSLLAGCGWERIGKIPSSSPRIGGALRGVSIWGGLLILLLAFADLASFGRTLYPLADPAVLLPVAPNVAAVKADTDVRAHQARILAPSAGVWLRFTSPRSYRQEQPGYQALWADTLTPNLTMPYGLSDAYGYEPVALKNAEATARKADRSFDPAATPYDRAQAARRAGTLAVKYVAVCRVRPPERSLSRLVVIRADPTLGPARPSRKLEPQAFIYLLRNAEWRPRARLEGSAAPVLLQDFGPDEVRLSCVSNGPARLILADTQAAGWVVTADGDPVPIETTGGCLRAIRLTRAGAHVVIFSYRPTPFRLGLYLSLLTLAALAGAASAGTARKIFRRGGITERQGE